MNRGYTREWYLDRIAAIRRIMPDCAISTDVIAGFCGETVEQHEATLSLMREVRYEMAFMFKYSERPRTLAEREVRGRRAGRREGPPPHRNHPAPAGAQQRATAAQCGRIYRVLVEGPSKKNAEEFQGRNTYNTMIVFPKGDVEPGQYH